MSPDKLFFMIQAAKDEEVRTGRYVSLLREKLPQLHLNIGIHDDNPINCLFKFSVEYIEMAPRLIECVEACAREADETDLFEPFIATATSYFIHPSAIFSRYAGLDGMMMKAYLCHRLMEEMYDNNKSIRNSNLVDVETTQANLLAHHLIGEPFANELDQATLITMFKLAGSPNYYDLDLNPFVMQAKHRAWEWMHDYWQGLLERNHIQFHFSLRHV